MIFKNLTVGTMELLLTTADLPSFLNSMAENRIRIYQFRKIDEVSAKLKVHHRDYKRLSEICENKGNKVFIQKKHGFIWKIYAIASRPVILFILFFFLVLMLYLPSRIFFVQVDGNNRLSEQEIISAGERCGIIWGAEKREVRSEKIKNALLSELPALQWAGVNTKGCIAVISVREKTEPENDELDKKYSVGNIVAERDGVITSCSLENGSLVCSVGQAVQEGQILISGFTDCGLCIRAVQASGEIYAKTQRNLSVIIPSDYVKSNRLKSQKRNYSIVVGKKRINLWKGSGISDVTCDRMYEEYYVTLPGGFKLPIGLGIDSYRFYEQNITLKDSDQISLFAAEEGKRYIQQQMVAGKIDHSSESFTIEEKAVSMVGSYICTEMIGCVQKNQIGEENVKNS